MCSTASNKMNQSTYFEVCLLKYERRKKKPLSLGTFRHVRCLCTFRELRGSNLLPEALFSSNGGDGVKVRCEHRDWMWCFKMYNVPFSRNWWMKWSMGTLEQVLTYHVTVLSNNFANCFSSTISSTAPQTRSHLNLTRSAKKPASACKTLGVAGGMLETLVLTLALTHFRSSL